jgi:hypothetical protein
MVILKKEHSDFLETNRKCVSLSHHHSRIIPTLVSHRVRNNRCSRYLCFDKWTIINARHLVTPVDFLINFDREYYCLRYQGPQHFPLY